METSDKEKTPAPPPKVERRRRRPNEQGEDVESEDEGPSIENSEYESAVDDSADQEEETEEGSETETEEGSETEEGTGTDSGTEYTDEEGLEEERQSGDGEEQPDSSKPDDDEDQKNPAYVPRKGAFYEHDFRQGGEGPEPEVPEEAKPKKKLWQDEGKWLHDRFNDEMQAPKSRQELIDIYGYDIRSADRPPENAPRRERRPAGPRKQHFQDFLPRMAVIDTTEGGHDSVPNLGGDDFIPRSERRYRAPHSGLRRGGGRDGFRDFDVELRNRKNRPTSQRTGQDDRSSIVSSSSSQAADFSTLTNSVEQKDPKENQSYRVKDISDVKSNYDYQAPKPFQFDNQSYTNYNENRNRNRNKFQQSQDIRKQDDFRKYNHVLQANKEDRRDGTNIYAQAEYRKLGYNEMKREPYGSTSPGSQSDYGQSRRNKPQVSPDGSNRNPRMTSSGDSGAYGNNKRVKPTDNQLSQPEISGADSNKEVREFTNTSYRYPDTTKVKNVPSPSLVEASQAVPTASQSLVISNKENVQTINVTITSTTTEKKSYAKERRAKGVSRPVDGALVASSVADGQAVSVLPLSGGHYQGLPQAGVQVDLPAKPLSATAAPYSVPLRQQGIFSEPPPVNNAGAKLYHPSLPPPSFFSREHGLPPGQLPVHTTPGVQDPAHFSPLLPPTPTLQFGLPGATTSGIPSNQAALFQPSPAPPSSNSLPVAPSAMLAAASFLPAGMIYAGNTRVSPSGAGAAYPMTLAYTSPPPQGAVTPGVVGNQPPGQVAPNSQTMQATSAHHKKVYRGDITYYAPELQQPSRTPQKRPKSAIPIIDPQAILSQKAKETLEQRGAKGRLVISGSADVLSAVAAPTGHERNTVARTEADLNTWNNSSLVQSQGECVRGMEPAVITSSTIVATEPEHIPAASRTGNHVKNMVSAAEDLESKRISLTTEFSPGGPPVTNFLSGQDTEQSLITTLQNCHLETSTE